MKLHDGLTEILSTELLDGANQYMCGNCNQKCNAVRYIRLKVLPPTLHFQVNRYVFDTTTFEKKKINAAIEFPRVIDMAAYTQSKSPINYILKACLFHKGGDTNSGHYVTRVYNEQYDYLM
jgi:ubiquitin carboxyl-terminal hydrolase 48